MKITIDEKVLDHELDGLIYRWAMVEPFMTEAEIFHGEHVVYNVPYDYYYSLYRSHTRARSDAQICLKHYIQAMEDKYYNM